MVNYFSSIMALTRSPIETSPITRPFSTTGRCRQRRSVLNPMHSSQGRVGGTPAAVGRRAHPPRRVSRRAAQQHDFAGVVALAQDPQEIVAFDDEHGADVVL